MTIETKYNINDLVRYKEAKNNTLLGTTKEGKIISIGFLYSCQNDIFISYTVVNPVDPLDTQIVFEQQIIGRV